MLVFIESKENGLTPLLGTGSFSPRIKKGNELQTICLTKEQTIELAKLHSRHLLFAHLYQGNKNSVIVEFEFPYRYVIAKDGTSHDISVWY